MGNEQDRGFSENKNGEKRTEETRTREKGIKGKEEEKRKRHMSV